MHDYCENQHGNWSYASKRKEIKNILESKSVMSLLNNSFFFNQCEGLLCKCVLPAALDETKVRHIRAENKVRDVDKKKLRSQSSRFEPSNSTSSTLSDCSTASASRSRRQRRCVPPSSSMICAIPQQETVS